MIASNEEFTEINYKAIVKQAMNTHLFVGYEFKGTECHVIWRHDVDFSLNRALALAKIEKELGVTSTWFILLRSEYYNPLEVGASCIIKKILDLGHKIGLHLDLSAYPDIVSFSELERAVSFESGILENAFGISISEFSFHNPNSRSETFDDVKVGPYLNASASYFRSAYEYASDSNGYWRFKSIPETIREAEERNLCILTHPVWWVPAPLSPFERIKRAINGRARYTENHYTSFLAVNNRKNIGSET
jgi:hypothetical protein